MSSESILSSIFSALRSPERSRKLEGARELREAVVACSRESPRSSLRLNQEVNKLIFELIRSPDPSLRLGGVLAIDQLVPMDLSGEDSGFNATRFMHYLRQVLLTSDIEVIRAAAAAIGHLARSGGTLAGDLVEYEVKRCCEWLTLERQETKRLAAAVELKALGTSAPTLIFAYTNTIIESLWSGIRDPKLSIRQDSVGALGVCLQIVHRRDSAIQESVYTSVWQQARLPDLQTAATLSTEQIHGSVLVFRELLVHAGRFMEGNKYKEALNSVLAAREHKDALIRRTVVDVLPSFASFNSQLFASEYLRETTTYLLQLLQTAKSSDRGQVFISLGRIALAVRVSFAPFIEPVIQIARETMANAKARARHEQEPGIFRCLNLFAQAFGQALTKHVDGSFLRLLFSCGLTRQLYECLASIYANLPALQDEIRDLLLNVVAQGLSGFPYHMPGQPEDADDEDEGHNQKQLNSVLAHEYRQQMLQKIGTENRESADEDAVISFLRIIAEFDFRGRSLAHFCKTCVLSYVKSTDPRVRKAAALTCISVFTREPIAREHSRLAVQTVQNVLSELLSLAAADPNHDLRLEVLKALDSRLDAHLSQPENVRVLLVCANDESFAVRLVAVRLLGRLCQVNPAYIAPPLRRAMIELLTDLEYSTNSRGREESARLLGALVRAAQYLAQPYIDPLFTVVLDAANTSTAAVSSAAMDAAGELCTVGGKRAAQHSQVLMPLVLSMLGDQGSPARRDSALRTLGKLAVHAEYVIKPYFEYPLLLPTLIRILTTETPLETRRETVKLLGTLGALDPYRYREIERVSDDDDTDVVEQQQHQHVPEDVKLVLRGTPPSAEEYNPTVVIRSLMALLRDPAMAANHTRVVQAVLRIFESLGLRCVLFLNDVIPGLIAAMRANSLAMADLLFRQISSLTAVVRQHIRPSLPVLFPVVTEYFQYPQLHGAVLSLVEALANALGRDFKSCIPNILPRLIAVLQSDDGDNSPLSASKVRVLHCLPVLGPCLSEYAHLVYPNVVNLFSFEPDVVRNAAFRCVSLLVQNVQLGSLASRVVLPLIRSMAMAQDDETRAAALQTLCDVCYQLGPDFSLFVATASSTINALRMHAQHHAAANATNTSTNQGASNTDNPEQSVIAIAPLLAVYDRLVSKILRNEPLKPEMNPALNQLSQTAPPPPSEQKSTLAINQDFLRHSWDTTGRSTSEDWIEWFRRISVEFLKQSPSPAMRACADIAVISPTLSRDLFCPSFYTVWAQLDDKMREDLVDSVHTAMAATNVPPDVLQTLLTLAEFMERDDKPLSLSPKVLAEYAEKCHAYAKALHYKEQEFMADPSSSNIESLIAINNQLQQSDAAVGILKHAQQHHVLQLKESWYEKLQRWEEALAAYSVREKLEPDNSEVFLGKMRSLHALGEWEQLSSLAREKWDAGDSEVRSLVAPLAAAAAWGLNEWEEMDKYVNQISRESPDRSFFSAVLHVHRGDIKEAESQVQKARDQLLPELSALVSESYSRAYYVCVRVQMLSELEEVMAYMKLGDFAETERESLRRTWELRLLGCQRNVDTWQRVLNVRTLVLEPKENMLTWIKFANLCRKSNRLALAEKSLNMLLDIDDETGERRAPPQLVYAQLKFMHATNNQQEALRYLVEFAKRMSSDLNLSPDNLIGSPLPYDREDMTEEIAEYTKLLARCFLKQGEWQVQLNPNWCHKGALKDSILGSYLLATHFDPNWYKAWHNWAIANFEATKVVRDHDIHEIANANNANNNGQVHLSKNVNSSAVSARSARSVRSARSARSARSGSGSGSGSENDDVDSLIGTEVNSVHSVVEDDANSADDLESVPDINETVETGETNENGENDEINDNGDNDVSEAKEHIEHSAATIIHVVPAIKGFFHSISLSSKSALQDTLRLITLWFTYGGHSEPARALADGFEMVALEQWLDVVPQLISRIHQTNDTVRETLHGLLTELGRKHPQALVYPLQVSIKSDNEFRKTAAARILDAMRLHSPATATLVEQADLVSHELIRVAVLWHEQWHEGLEDASRDYFVDKNIDKMFATLEPLHATLSAGATTLREMSFKAAFGRDLFDAHAWGENYKRTGDEKHLNQAWDIYYNVFQRISRQLPQLTSLNLQYVSPKLLEAKDLQLAVPGTYEPNKPVTTITLFEKTFNVISSKQRPRKFVVLGSDGKKYQYVLKGHEDLRQDSLVMQLFGLVNTLLSNNDECFKRHLCIQRFPVIPLSPKTGLLGWVPHSDTLHFLIREHREGKSLLNIEHRIMIQMAPDYDRLTHLQKIEVFTYALDNTKGHDLYKILWLKSQSSEVWLNRRTEYTRSLAVMSMVGYILGLGDRHPLNLMLDRITGRIIHIDFGDCFEAAILREKFPEKVPFRLTRMLTYATEVSGVEGSFRITCEHVMALIRDNAESLMAILEAFAYDPLINWGFELPKDMRSGDSNARPRMVLQRIEDKFSGNDFKRKNNLNVADQVNLLIQEATSIENLCQHFIGWCAFW